MVICLERGADVHTAQLMPLPLTVSCFSKIQIGFTVLVPAHLGSPGRRAVKRVCVCVCVFVLLDNQPISDGEATDHCQKVTSQDGGLSELIVARFCLTNHSEASRP